MFYNKVNHSILIIVQVYWYVTGLIDVTEVINMVHT